MDIYDYVAANDPYGTKAIINKYGYSFQNVESSEDLGEMLRQTVATEGMPVLRDVVDLHPDKDLIIEQNSQKAIQAAPSGSCGCGGKCKEKTGKSVSDEYLAATQNSNQTNGVSLHQGNLFLMGGVLILAVAIIVSSNK